MARRILFTKFWFTTKSNLKDLRQGRYSWAHGRYTIPTRPSVVVGVTTQTDSHYKPGPRRLFVSVSLLSSGSQNKPSKLGTRHSYSSISLAPPLFALHCTTERCTQLRGTLERPSGPGHGSHHLGRPLNVPLRRTPRPTTPVPISSHSPVADE